VTKYDTWVSFVKMLMLNEMLSNQVYLYSEN